MKLLAHLVPRFVAFNFAPKGYAICNGQTLPINTNQPLFSLLGTTYGGNGQTTFALPNLQGRVPIHMGQSHTLGERGGEETHTLLASEMPAHIHVANADSGLGSVGIPTGNMPAKTSPLQAFSAGGSGMQAVSMSSQMVLSAGGSQPHENRQPYTVLNFCIALQGIFPSRS